MSILGASALTGFATLGSTYLQNAMASREASKNREFQREMSNTAHQREVADLRAAGLNPILSVSGGSGASSPSGSVAPVVDMLTPALATALQVFKTSVESRKIEAETAKINAERTSELYRPPLIEAQAASATADANLKYKQSYVQDQEESIKKQMLLLLDEQTKNEHLKRSIMSEDLTVAKAAAKRAVTENEIDSTAFGKIMRYIERAATLIRLVPRH